jgi:hypothetical protein
LASGLFIIVSAIFTATASLFAAPMAWPMWLLYVYITVTTLVCFRGFLAREFDYRVPRPQPVAGIRRSRRTTLRFRGNDE